MNKKLLKLTSYSVALLMLNSTSGSIAASEQRQLSEQRQDALRNQPTTQNSANFYDRRSEGWYWYEDEEAERKKKLEELKQQQQILIQQQQKKAEIQEVQQPKRVDIVDPQTGLLNQTIVVQAQEATAKPLSAEWLKQKMPQMLQSALDNPYDEKGRPSKEMQAYMYMQRLTLDKAQNFADSATTLTQLDPFLDENSRVPIDNAANRAFAQANSANQQKVVDYLTKNVGLWFVYDTSCSFCVAQYEYLKDFKKINNFKIMNISMDGSRLPNMPNDEIIYQDRGQAKTLRLRITPSIVMLVPPNNFYVVSQGLMSQGALLNRILLVAEKYNVLPKDMKELLDPYAKGVLTPEQIQQMQKVQKDLDADPTKIVDVIHEAVGY